MSQGSIGVLMRALYGQGTPREAAEAVPPYFVLQSDAALAFGLIATVNEELDRNRHPRHRPDAKLKNRDFINGLLRWPRRQCARYSL